MPAWSSDHSGDQDSQNPVMSSQLLQISRTHNQSQLPPSSPNFYFEPQKMWGFRDTNASWKLIGNSSDCILRFPSSPGSRHPKESGLSLQKCLSILHPLERWRLDLALPATHGRRYPGSNPALVPMPVGLKPAFPAGKWLVVNRAGWGRCPGMEDFNGSEDFLLLRNLFGNGSYAAVLDEKFRVQAVSEIEVRGDLDWKYAISDVRLWVSPEDDVIMTFLPYFLGEISNPLIAKLHVGSNVGGTGFRAWISRHEIRRPQHCQHPEPMKNLGFLHLANSLTNSLKNSSSSSSSSFPSTSSFTTFIMDRIYPTSVSEMNLTLLDSLEESEIMIHHSHKFKYLKHNESFAVICAEPQMPKSSKSSNLSSPWRSVTGQWPHLFLHNGPSPVWIDELQLFLGIGHLARGKRKSHQMGFLPDHYTHQFFALKAQNAQTSSETSSPFAFRLVAASPEFCFSSAQLPQDSWKMRGTSFLIGFVLVAHAELHCQSDQSVECAKEKESRSKVLLQTRVNGRSQTFKVTENEPLKPVKLFSAEFAESADGDPQVGQWNVGDGDIEDEQVVEDLWPAEVKAATLVLFPLTLSFVSMALSYLWFNLVSLKTEDGDGQPVAKQSPLPAATLKRLAKDSSYFLQRKFGMPKLSVEHVPPDSIEPEKKQVAMVQTQEKPMAPCLCMKLHPGEKYSGGEIVVEALRLSGVERLFGIPGVQNLALYNAISHPSPSHPQPGRTVGTVAMHLIGNEEAAAYMAWGVWHKEKRLGCACLIGGPGVTHALAGVACAFRDATPLLVLTAGVRAGKERFQLHDVDNLAVLKPVCKALFRPASVEEIGQAIYQACRCSLEGRPGPVGVEIACDLYNKHGSFEWDSTNPMLQGPVQEPWEPLPTQPAPALAVHASDPMVSFIKNLILQAHHQKLNCILVAEPGYCAEIAAVAWESDKSWQLLCPGCGSRPSGFAAENPGVAVPSAIGVARGEAGQRHQDPNAKDAGGRPGLVIAFFEASALVPQGLELSHAQGLPLLLVVINNQTMDTLLMAQSILFAAKDQG
eukprot:Skav224282  [mRNA]  locus=scaffold1019:87317:96411:+ [translate_table: standard]